MELKNYQKTVITDLKCYLNHLNRTHSADTAYRDFWLDKGITVGENLIPAYKNTIQNTPHICFKVPTGGGKTYLAAAAIKPILSSMPETKQKLIVWLVPSDTILEQTTKNLQNPDHPYHQKLAADFGGKLAIYTKHQLLNGQNFSPAALSDQLSLIILSYDSLRSKTKENRKLYQENGSLASFPAHYRTPQTLLEGIDETAAIQVINQLSPIVIVDESHHATTDLSIEMLKNLNPSFILDLTATPKTNSNIISYVDASQLKRENMVKLPVIVYNRKTKDDVIYTAIDLRTKLEQFATEEQTKTGTYIRPIILFQAEPRGKETAETYQKIKENLIKAGIPQEQIAIKTATINEIKNTDLLNPSCPIRYIITINALKEGWDCPFAYILATLANRSSKIDVEQIVGRILRQPHTRKHQNNFLNISYIFTSSDAFQETVDTILKGLNNAGYSRKDYRIVEYGQIPEGQASIDNFPPQPATEDEPFQFDYQHIHTQLTKSRDQQTNSNSPLTSPQTDILTHAETLTKTYIEQIETETRENSLLPQDLREKMQPNRIYDKYQTEIEHLQLPQFYREERITLFNDQPEIKLTKELLGKDFTLKDKTTKIDFDDINTEIGTLDIDESDTTTPKYQMLSEPEIKYFRQTFSEIPRESKLRNAKSLLFQKLNTIDSIESSDLSRYLDHIVENLTPDQLSDLQATPHLYADKIKKHIIGLLDDYREEQFKKLNDVLRQRVLNEVPHYGNDDPYADVEMKYVMDLYYNITRGFSTCRCKKVLAIWQNHSIP